MLKRLLELKISVVETAIEFDLVIKFKWSDVEYLANFLKPIHDITNQLQSNSSCFSKVIPHVLELKDHLQKTLSSSSHKDFKKDICKFMNIFDKKIAHMVNSDHIKFQKIYLVATMLDPKSSYHLTDDLFKLGKTLLTDVFDAESSKEIALIPDQSLQKISRRTISSEQIYQNPTKVQLENYICSLDKGLFFDTDIDFWINKGDQFPDLKQIALPILSIPATSASCERLFSIAGNLSRMRRSSIKPTQLRSRTICSYNKDIVKDVLLMKNL